MAEGPGLRSREGGIHIPSGPPRLSITDRAGACILPAVADLSRALPKFHIADRSLAEMGAAEIRDASFGGGCPASLAATGGVQDCGGEHVQQSGTPPLLQWWTRGGEAKDVL